MKQFNSLLLALFVCCGTVTLCSGVEIKTDIPFIDEAKILTVEQGKEISAFLMAHNQKGPGKIFVIIVKQLPAETSIDKFAWDTINKPPLKANEKADRVLLAIAIQDRKLRIETSRDVWGVLPDAFLQDVLTKTITPQFKEKKFFDGIQAGIKALSTKLSK